MIGGHGCNGKDIRFFVYVEIMTGRGQVGQFRELRASTSKPLLCPTGEGGSQLPPSQPGQLTNYDYDGL